jgi:hypothetical protein
MPPPRKRLRIAKYCWRTALPSDLFDLAASYLNVHDFAVAHRAWRRKLEWRLWIDRFCEKPVNDSRSDSYLRALVYLSHVSKSTRLNATLYSAFDLKAFYLQLVEHADEVCVRIHEPHLRIWVDFTLYYQEDWLSYALKKNLSATLSFLMKSGFYDANSYFSHIPNCLARGDTQSASYLRSYCLQHTVAWSFNIDRCYYETLMSSKGVCAVRKSLRWLKREGLHTNGLSMFGVPRKHILAFEAIFKGQWARCPICWLVYTGANYCCRG